MDEQERNLQIDENSNSDGSDNDADVSQPGSRVNPQ
jgi:hypothetical protein